MAQIPQLIQTGLWQWTSGTGLERYELLQTSDEWILRGTILMLADHYPAEARYEVICDQFWRTKNAHISVTDQNGQRTLHINSDNGRWYANDQLNESVDGCTDIDLGWSPSTNTLPIRRLSLDVGGGSGTLTAAWVRFPDLSLQPLSQEYQRLAERQYRYSSRGGAFTALLSVDDDGLVLEYEGFWRRLGSWSHGLRQSSSLK